MALSIALGALGFAPLRTEGAAPTAADAAALRADLLRQAEATEDAYRARLGALATALDTAGDAPAAATVRAWLPARHPLELHLPLVAPQTGPRPAADSTASAPDAAVAPGPVQFMELRRARAEELWQLARQAAEAEAAPLAYRLALGAVREDPEHAAAREALGYQHVAGRWLTRREAELVRARQVWHPEFGWLPESRLQRYAAGERYLRGRWVSAEADAAAHARIDHGWEVASEHYLVRTNAGLETGVALAARLERLADAWQQVFLPYALDPRDVLRRFRGESVRPEPARRLDVVYYATRDEYLAALRPVEPQIEITKGFYRGANGTAYFHAGPEADEGYLMHEAVHQLFARSRPTVPRPGAEANFWIIEGIACYFESFAADEHLARLGGADGERLRAARYRRLVDDFYVPLAEFTALGSDALQRDPRIARLYTQAAGLTYFLMHYDGGRYRDALVEYLTAVYTGRDDRETLARATGASYAQLDAEYREFLAALPDPARP